MILPIITYSDILIEFDSLEPPYFSMSSGGPSLYYTWPFSFVNLFSLVGSGRTSYVKLVTWRLSFTTSENSNILDELLSDFNSHKDLL